VSKFKVGDRVRTTARLDEVPAGTIGFVTELDGYVRVYFGEYPRQLSGYDAEWPYKADELELVEDEPQPYDMPSPEADALDRIADVIKDWFTSGENIGSLIDIRDIIRETGRL
jgi:hypothetical protein